MILSDRFVPTIGRAVSGLHRRTSALPLLLLLALALRWLDPRADALSYDELQSLTFAGMHWREAVWGSAIFDAHPSAYYLLLHLWMLAGTAAIWLKASSVLTHLFTLGLLYYAGRCLFGTATSITAALLFALAPLAAHYGVTLRMYSLMMLLSLLLMTLNHFLVRGGVSRWTALVFTGALVLALYSHGAAFLLFVALFGQAMVQTLQRRPRCRHWDWIKYQAVALLLYLPWLGYAYTRRWFIGDAHGIESLRSLAKPPAELIMGFGWSGDVPIALAVLVLVLVLGGAAALERRARPLVYGFVLLPLLVTVALSLFVQPIWLVRSLAYLLPVVILVAARLPWRLPAGSIRWLALAALLLLSTVGLWGQIHVDRDRFLMRDLATWISEHAEPGDLVLAATPKLMWGLSWYLAGPHGVDDVYQRVVEVPESDLVLTAAEIPPRHTGRGWLVSRSQALEAVRLPILDVRVFGNLILLEVALPQVEATAVPG